MYRNVAARVSLVASAAVCFLMAGATMRAGEIGGGQPPTVAFATRHGKSASLRDYRPAGPVAPRPNREIHNEVMPKKGSGASRPTSDAAVQKRFGLSQPSPQIQFEGASDQDNAAVTGKPDRSAGHGGRRRPEPLRPVHQQRRRDLRQDRQHRPRPVRRATRSGPAWAGPARSRTTATRSSATTGRPTAGCFRSSRFPTSRTVRSTSASPSRPRAIRPATTTSTNSRRATTFFTDYGKLGIWPDAYYMSFNMFGPDNAFLGGAYAFDRAAMIAGDPSAAMIAFDTGQEGGVLPSDLDGPTPPPAGAPNYFMTFEVGPARLLQWQFHADWTTPENSTFTGPVEIPAAEFIYPVCDAPRGQCVPQLDTTEKLETLQEKLMYRLAYRNFGDHESLVVNHTVGTDAGAAAVRWYEIRSPGDAPVIYQQGTYAPDASYRWMGSIAMDRNGNIALGYSKSSPSMHPGDRDHRAARRRPARPDGRRGRLVRRRRQPDQQLQPLGRLQHDVHRSGRRLHVLVHAGVLRLDRRLRLQDAHRLLPVPELHGRRSRRQARGHRDRRLGPDRGRDGGGDAVRRGHVDDRDRRSTATISSSSCRSAPTT